MTSDPAAPMRSDRSGSHGLPAARLTVLFEDLPPASPPTEPRGTSAGAVRRAVPGGGPRRRPGLTPWLIIGIICLAVWVTTSIAVGLPLFFWPLWVVGPWGAVLLMGRLTGRPMAGCGRPRNLPER